MKWFILANGEATRWKNYLGVPKHLIEIDGETLIHRMVRLLKENGQDDITIIGSYQIDGAKNVILENTDTKYKLFKEISKLSDTPYALLNGDCFYTDAIIKDVISRKIDKWGHWCCQRPNKITGKPWEEGYIHAVFDTKWFNDKITEYCDKVAKGEINHISDWCINRYLIGIDLYIHQPQLMKEFDIDWEDETDDFDFPVDYDRFIEKTGRK